MKKLLIIIISAILLSGCSFIVSSSGTTYVHRPQQIIYYNNGNQDVLENGGDKYNVILSLVEKIIQDTEGSGVMKSVHRNPHIEIIKASEYALELVYDEPIQKHLTVDGRRQTFEYSSLFIPLNNNVVFIGRDQVYNNRGLSVSFIPRELVEALLDRNQA